MIRMNSKKAVMDWVYIAKGIGMILVVFGHFHPENSPRYYSVINALIYSFHMPLFFIISGLLYDYKKLPYSEFVKTKTKRLAIPFMTIAGLFFLVKFVMAKFVVLDHPVNWRSVLALIVDPVHSYMPLLWFVHALFFMFIIYPLLRKVIKYNFIIIILLCLANTVDSFHFYGFSRMLSCFPFFVFGILLREERFIFNKIACGQLFVIPISIGLFSTMFLLSYQVALIPYLVKFLLGLCGTVLVLSVSHMVAWERHLMAKQIISSIGYYSMTIYLFHTLFESAVRIVAFQKIGVTRLSFEVVALLAVTVGIFFPILLEKFILRKFTVTKKYVLGLA